MGPLAALLVATPLFGLSLDLDPSLASPPLAGAPLAAVSATAASGAGGPSASEAETTDPASAAEPTTAELMQQRGRIAPVHKWMGIATWISMTATVVLGGIQWHNLYGFFDDRDSNPCVEGDAIFGQGQCTGQPVAHLTSAVITTALYATTFGLSLRMPDPLNLDEGSGTYAKKLRRHKALRWVHFAGMIAQWGLGLIVANGSRLGLDRTNDYNALRALSTVHMALGLATWGALTAAGAIMLF